MKSWREANPHRHREYRYGISAELYQEMFEMQHGLCAICGKAMQGKNIHVDHNHVTGKIRALLCNCCNHMLGHAKENPDTLLKAAEYLQFHEKKI